MIQSQLATFFPGLPSAGPPSESEIKSVGIVGGGTAGYLTALALRKRLPNVEVTIIESSKIPIIGVGEATTPVLPKLLHYYLDIDICEFYREVQPTWKLGIKFDWGKPGEGFFNFPFDLGLLLESHLYTGNVNAATLESRLMSADRVPLYKTGKDTYFPAFHWLPYAYHLENRRFVKFLHGQLMKRGLKILDREILEARVTPDGEEIASLLTDAGEELKYDLYVDCSGFSSFLMGKALGSKFISYEKSLFTDRALVGAIPREGLMKPYTTAWTMDHGWCWHIPHTNEDHIGYVHASAFCSPEEAERELRQKYPQIGKTRLISYCSGRREHFWKGNTIAIGNSYGFVEPLESSALHMIAEEINWLVSCFPRTRNEIGTRTYLNHRVNGEWDMLRAFLAIHYKFNERRKTPFWRACQETTDVGLAAGFIQLFSERAPLSYCARELRPFDDHLNNQFGRYGWDNVLMGLGVEGNYVQPAVSRETWDIMHAGGDELVESAMNQNDALQLLQERPDLLTGFVDGPNSWLPHAFPTILKPIPADGMVGSSLYQHLG
jgi:tryptophan 7-halogenase